VRAEPFDWPAITNSKLRDGLAARVAKIARHEQGARPRALRHTDLAQESAARVAGFFDLIAAGRDPVDYDAVEQSTLLRIAERVTPPIALRVRESRSARSETAREQVSGYRGIPATKETAPVENPLPALTRAETKPASPSPPARQTAGDVVGNRGFPAMTARATVPAPEPAEPDLTKLSDARFIALMAARSTRGTQDAAIALDEVTVQRTPPGGGTKPYEEPPVYPVRGRGEARVDRQALSPADEYPAASRVSTPLPPRLSRPLARAGPEAASDAGGVADGIASVCVLLLSIGVALVLLSLIVAFGTQYGVASLAFLAPVAPLVPWLAIAGVVTSVIVVGVYTVARWAGLVGGGDNARAARAA
jgi:hypothetical protein